MLIRTESNVPETQAMFKEILENPEKVFDLIPLDFKGIAERALNEKFQGIVTESSILS